MNKAIEELCNAMTTRRHCHTYACDDCSKLLEAAVDKVITNYAEGKLVDGHG